MRPKRELAAVLTMPASLALLASLTLAGCGSVHVSDSGGRPAKRRAPSYPEAAMSAQQIYADVTAAARKVTSVRMTGHVTEGGDTMSLDLTLGRAGSRGTLTADGTVIHLLRIGSAGYVKVPRATAGNRLLNGIAQLPAGRWVKLPIAGVNADSGVYSLLGSMTIRKALGQIFTAGDPIAKVPGIHLIGGVATVELKDTADGSRLYVAVSGATRPIEIAGAQGAAGSVLFGDYGKPVALTRPAGAVSLPGTG